jgi:8-oxo-dGTP pyrophosphatase MutT (NUDIX family)
MYSHKEPKFIPFLRNHLEKENWPGRNAQMKMAPRPVSEKSPSRKMAVPPGVYPSSVLILIFPGERQRLKLVLTLRSADIRHGGQISLPGGRAERDERPVETALRETKEEIDIKPRDVSIVGQLSDLYVEHSDNIVTPVIGFIDYIPSFTIYPAEVEEVFSVALDDLLEKENLVVENWYLRNQEAYRVPYWDIHHVPLWGATAMILSEFLELYREFKELGSRDS